MTQRRDVLGSRNNRHYTSKEYLGRLCWSLVEPIFRVSPRFMWEWRRFLLVLFGAKIGRDVHIFPSVRITLPWNLQIGDESAIGDRAILYALGPIKIGARVTVSQGAHLCAGTHDWRKPDMPLLKPPIVLKDDCWICADAFIGPDVTVGQRAIVGARAVVVRDVHEATTVVGNPARAIVRKEDGGLYGN